MTSGDIAAAATFYGSGERFATLDEIVDAARETLPADVWDFLAGGAGDESTLRANREAFGRWTFVPRVMSGADVPSTRTSFLGVDLSMPVLTAPFGADALFHPEGQRAVARANEAEGVASIVPEAGSHSLEEVRAAAPAAAMIAQLHPMGPEDNFRAMIARAAECGYHALCVTVDCPTGGWRERNLRNRFAPDPAIITGNYRAAGSPEPQAVFGQLFDRTEPVWSWDRLAGALADSPLPWLAKGILTGADAESAVAAGAAGILVSNHGGRQLDGAPAALDQLPEVVRAVAGRARVALDSGIRRGADVAKALALGADVVVIGRLAAHGLAAAGEAGVRRVHQLIRAELGTVLTLLGRGGVRELDESAVRRSPS
ncbi:alpha-hydroxy acid oxidase [Amycolatopsis alkalitolerans]|uniref:Alpha-hydroxy-acid oxidizing protein n=1 Tax=Amycolatopsis alkalitolerans TaxID=2547244 RepID=A0A5C4M277_9PSEU|nr:alpha-hydroxy acid oxidase [Amycolatopsis alkalitolerans]TNC25119.1 alpha-hydroxy-acid oxidizing protein [Amycolatopsis alkalitolerans]